MLVTEITAISKTQCKIYLDEMFAFVLYKGELASYDIRQGQEMDPEVYDRLMEEVLPKRAKKRAMYLLQKRDYTERQLQDKLLQGGYPAPVVGEALSYVRSFGYVDDARYAAQYVACQLENKSKGRILQDLCQKGICRETAQQALEETESLGQGRSEREKARAFLEKKRYLLTGETPGERQKVYAKACAFLGRKGFPAEIVYPVVQEYLEAVLDGERET